MTTVTAQGQQPLTVGQGQQPLSIAQGQQEQIVIVVEEALDELAFESPFDTFGICAECPFAWHDDECLAMPGQGCIPPEEPSFEAPPESTPQVRQVPRPLLAR